MLDRGQVSLGEVDDVDVVAQRGPVVGVVVAAEDADLRQDPGGDARDDGIRLFRDALRILPDQTALVRADRVEVPGPISFFSGAVREKSTMTSSHIFFDLLYGLGRSTPVREDSTNGEVLGMGVDRTGPRE